MVELYIKLWQIRRDTRTCPALWTLCCV